MPRSTEGRTKRSRIESHTRGSPLNEKETQTLEMLCGGREQQQIAAALNVHPVTVWYRLATAKRKLGATTNEQLAYKYAVLKRS